MSDGVWDAEYELADEYLSKIESFCNDNNIPVPDVGEFPRSWYLKEVLEGLKHQ